MKIHLAAFLVWFRKKRTISKIGLIALSIVAVFLFFANSVTRWYLNAHGEALTGRVLKVESLHLNYLTCSFTAGDVTLYEANQKDTFIHVGSLYANLSLWTLLSGDVEFSEVLVNRLHGRIKHDGTNFNFSDLYSNEKTDPNEAVTRFCFRNVRIQHSTISYEDTKAKVLYPLNDISIAIPELEWTRALLAPEIELKVGENGRLTFSFDLDDATESYAASLLLENVDANYGLPYIENLFNVKSVQGLVHADLKLTGSLVDPSHIHITGRSAVTNLHIVDNMGNPFASADSVGVLIDSLNIGALHFAFSESYLRDPIAYATVIPKSTNIAYFLQPLLSLVEGHAQEFNEGAEDESSLQNDAVNGPKPFHFSIEELVIKEGQIRYCDKTLHRPFEYRVHHLNARAHDMSTASHCTKVWFSANSGEHGTISGYSEFDLLSPQNMQLQAEVADVELTELSAYSEYYVGAPIRQGLFNYTMGIRMNPTQMENSNYFHIQSLEFGKRIKGMSKTNVPIQLALMMMKNRHNAIEFELPVSGNPSDPDFKIMPIIWRSLSSFMIKVATSPLASISGVLRNGRTL